MANSDIRFRQSTTEADIDWLVTSELNTNPPFRDWFASRLLGTLTPVKHIKAWRSISHHNGESDLLWHVKTRNDQDHFLMIENKINAPAQPDQYARYVKRGEFYVSKGECRTFLALLAPKHYTSQDAHEYPLRLDYEDFYNWYKKMADEKSAYFAWIFDYVLNRKAPKSSAAGGSSEKGQAPIDEDMLNFQYNALKLARLEFPNLHVPEPKHISATQDWIYMRYSGYTVIYKMYKEKGKYYECCVDLELAGRGEDLIPLGEKYRPFMADTDVTLEKTGKSASFRKSVPLISPPVFEEEKVREAFISAETLIEWWEKVKIEKD